jgi:hypothetical protein
MSNISAVSSSDTSGSTTSTAPVSGTVTMVGSISVSGTVTLVRKSSTGPYVRIYTDNTELSLVTVRKTDGVVSPYGIYDTGAGTAAVYLAPTDFTNVYQTAAAGMQSGIAYNSCGDHNISSFQIGALSYQLTTSAC